MRSMAKGTEDDTVFHLRLLHAMVGIGNDADRRRGNAGWVASAGERERRENGVEPKRQKRGNNTITF